MTEPESIDSKFLATERLLIDELAATDLIVRYLDDGIDPSPIWIAQALWGPSSSVVRIEPWRLWGVGESETAAMIALADAILHYRLCPYCHQQTRLLSVEPKLLELTPEEKSALLAEEAERRLGQPIELECCYEWNSAEARFKLNCAEGSDN
jgi:hypothetical protein